MAIQKTKTLPNGVTGDYWRLSMFHVDIDKLRVEFVISLFVDSTHGTNGSAPLMSKRYKFPVNPQQLATGSLSTAYQRILDQANVEIDDPFNPGQTILFDSDLAGGTIV